MLENTSNRKILGVDPGTREIGVAVLSGKDLEYYGVKTITERQSPSSILVQGSQIVYRLINTYKPQILALERPFLGFGNRSATLVALSREFHHLGESLGLEVREINPKTAKKLISGNGDVTKRELAIIICRKYPELQIYLGQSHESRTKYWQNAFDAIAVALAIRA